MLNTGRTAIKITGESGQGLDSVGQVIAKSIKRSGFYTFGYREYPSLIKGGWASHQIDVSDHPVNAPSRDADIMLSLSRVSLHQYIKTLKKDAQVIHTLPLFELTDDEQEFVEKQNIKIFYLRAEEIALETGGKAIMANVVLVGTLWQLLNLPIGPVEDELKEEFAHKPQVVEPNLKCLKKGYETDLEGLVNVDLNLKANPDRKTDALLTGNHLVSLGAIASGVRAYFAYPMTPSSSILTYLANFYHETGMLVKQLDDEISVAQTAIGAMFMGTRSLVATSGGGYDLMTETISLAGITETPFVCVLAQRPGPATGLPTWSSDSDLNLAVYAGHGEYPKCVIAIHDAISAFTLIQNAFNIAEKYQIPVIVLTDKEIAEGLYQMDKLPESPAVQRHLVEGEKLKNLEAHDRYQITDSGISPRWLPGNSETTFVANSDEHYEDGTVTEEAVPAQQMYEKRLRKINTLLKELPEPETIGPSKAKITFVGWGSAKDSVLDAIKVWNDNHSSKQVNMLLYEYIYPVKTGKLIDLIKKRQKMVLIESNAFGQLGALLTQHTGYIFEEKLLKYDGRPFFVEEILEFLEEKL